MAEDGDPEVIDFEQLKKRPKTRTRSDDFYSLYSNSLNVEATFNDVKLFFGQVVEATQEKVVLEEDVAIILTPEQAKSILKALTSALENYESTYGPIRNPPGR